MRLTSMAVLVSAIWLTGCASDGAIAPVAPSLAVSSEGNPPPPRVLGTLGALFTGAPGELARAQQYMFRGAAYYNRNLTTGMNLFEMASGAGNIRANSAGVVRASGVVVLVNPTTGAQLTVDLGQLVGFTGPLFVPCPPGSAVNCFVFDATLTGVVQPVGGPPVQVTGQFKYRWETD